MPAQPVVEKTGRKEPEDISHKEAVLWGIELEPVLAQVYAKRTGYKVRRVNAVLQHPEQPFMLANLDREVVGHPDGPGILEIKTASYHSAPSGRKECRWLTSVRYSISWRYRPCLG
jgi:putative phage-type endonuclease